MWLLWHVRTVWIHLQLFIKNSQTNTGSNTGKAETAEARQRQNRKPGEISGQAGKQTQSRWTIRVRVGREHSGNQSKVRYNKANTSKTTSRLRRKSVCVCERLICVCVSMRCRCECVISPRYEGWWEMECEWGMAIFRRRFPLVVWRRRYGSLLCNSNILDSPLAIEIPFQILKDAFSLPGFCYFSCT